jgi:hypothetical protein
MHSRIDRWVGADEEQFEPFIGKRGCHQRLQGILPQEPQSGLRGRHDAVVADPINERVTGRSH